MTEAIWLDHCVLHVSDWEKPNAFCRDVVGAEVVPNTSGYVYRFQPLNLHGPGVNPTPVARLPVPPGGSDLCFGWPGTAGEAQQHLSRHPPPQFWGATLGEDAVFALARVPQTWGGRALRFPKAVRISEQSHVRLRILMNL